MPSGEMLRWFGTTLIAGSFGIIALFGIIVLALAGRMVPDTLPAVATLAAGGFFAAFGAMVGGRASQNGAQVQAGVPPSDGGLH